MTQRRIYTLVISEMTTLIAAVGGPFPVIAPVARSQHSSDASEIENALTSVGVNAS